MRGSRRIVWYAAVILIGAALWIWSFGFGGGDYVQGLGTGLIAVGVLKLVRNIRYITDSDYREKADIAVNDERNRYISKSAWAWSGYICPDCGGRFNRAQNYGEERAGICCGNGSVFACDIVLDFVRCDKQKELTWLK